MPDRFQRAEEEILKTLKLHPQLTMPQCHRVSGLEDRTESRRLVDQLVRDGVLILTDEGGTKFYSRSPELSTDDPPPSPTPTTPEPPAAMVELPAEIPPTVHSPAETSSAAPEILPPPHVKTSRYPGVCFDRTTQRWRSFCTFNGKTKNLGSNYPTEEAAFRAREEFMHQHQMQSTPLTANVPKAPETIPEEAPEATAPGDPAAPAEHTIHVCRLAVYSPYERTRQELVIDKMVREGLAAARTAGHAGAVVIYSDEVGEVTGRETYRF